LGIIHEQQEISDADTGVDFIGPFTHHEVVVGGYAVPYLTADVLNGGRVCVTVDNRFAVELSLDEAQRIVPFLANCIAVASGFNAHPTPEWGEPSVRTPYARLSPLYSETA
jgi:hypothetical protein